MEIPGGVDLIDDLLLQAVCPTGVVITCCAGVVVCLGTIIC